MSGEREPDLTLAGLVHDLNNVFETLNEAAELLAADAKWAGLAAAIERSVERGRRLVDCYRESSASQADLDRTVHSAIEFTRDFLHAVHGPPIEFKSSIEPGFRISGGAANWERVFVNLFTNAAQAMPGGGTIEISARRAGSLIEIAVGDTGRGIPPEILPRIFQPRFSTKAAPSGLGLHIVESIVKENGGTVCASGRPDGPGAVFRIDVPAPAGPQT